MLSGKDLILATRVFTKENRSASWWYTLSTLCLLIALFVGSASGINIGFRLLCSLMSVLALSRMFVIYHDYLHKAILDKSLLAKIIFYVFGLFTLAPVSIWKRSHDYHHKHNSKLFSAGIGSYPVMTSTQFLAASSKDKFLYLATRHPVTIIMGYVTMFVYGMCIRSFINSPRRHYDSFLALVLHLFLGSVLFIKGGIATLLITLIVPFSLTFALGAYLFYAQHNFPGVQFQKNTDWQYDVAAMHSSSYMVMGKLMNWATANIGYHHIHHLNCRIPFYRLPEAFHHIAELREVTTTSLGLKDIMACLQLKVWDAEQYKMLTMSELKASLQQQETFTNNTITS